MEICRSLPLARYVPKTDKSEGGNNGNGGARRLCWTDAFPWLGVLQPNPPRQTDSPLDEDAWNDAVRPWGGSDGALLAVVYELALDRMARGGLSQSYSAGPGRSRWTSWDCRSAPKCTYECRMLHD